MLGLRAEPCIKCAGEINETERDACIMGDKGKSVNTNVSNTKLKSSSTGAINENCLIRVQEHRQTCVSRLGGCSVVVPAGLRRCLLEEEEEGHWGGLWEFGYSRR